MKSLRINLLVSPEEKAQIDERAQAARLTTSELVRRAVAAYQPDQNLDDLKLLIDELAAAADRMERKLDATLEKLKAHERAFVDKSALKAEALTELKRSGEVWPFALPQAVEPV
ncbi:MAG: ribbon-helix-helix protein, CopG family [Geminicoccaceae bacterium]